MKKRKVTLCGILCIALMIISTLGVVAADDESADISTEYWETETETESETETVETETETEDDLEQLNYVRLEQDEETLIERISESFLDEEKEQKKAGTAVIVFWQHQKEANEETEKVAKKSITLKKEQQEYLQQVGSIYEEVIVLFNYCKPDEELYLSDNEQQVLALIEAKTMAEIEENIKTLDLEKLRKDYQKKQRKIKAKKGESESESETETETFVERETTAASEPSSETKLRVSGKTQMLNGTTSQREEQSDHEQSEEEDVTITLAMDEVTEADEELTATYEIVALKEVTKGSITITYDKEKMTYVTADESDALEEMTVEVKDPINGKSEEGTIEISFSSEKGVKLDGDLLDLEFALNKEAKKGEQHELKLTVDELKNKKTTLTAKVIQKAITVVGDADDENEEESDRQTESSTKKSTTSTNKSSGSQGKKSSSAPKTGDESNILLWVVICGISLFVVAVVRKKKSRYL